jgi:hypothetical protein
MVFARRNRGQSTAGPGWRSSRAQGRAAGHGPGRGKKESAALKSFRGLIKDLNLDPGVAQEAQRIGRLLLGGGSRAPALTRQQPFRRNVSS